MKKIIIASLAVGIIVGCLLGCQKTVDEDGKLIGSRILVIEGCEYLTSETGYPGLQGYNFSMTHKGNCRNSIHVYNKVE